MIVCHCEPFTLHSSRCQNAATLQHLLRVLLAHIIAEFKRTYFAIATRDCAEQDSEHTTSAPQQKTDWRLARNAHIRSLCAGERARLSLRWRPIGASQARLTCASRTGCADLHLDLICTTHKNSPTNALWRTTNSQTNTQSTKQNQQPQSPSLDAVLYENIP